jgi:Cd2+/Zn2+-exporting ATPase
MQDHHTDNSNNCSVCDADFAASINGVSIWRDRRFLIISVSTLFFIVGLIFDFLLGQMIVALFLFIFAASVAGYSIAIAGFKGLVFRRRLNIAFLMTIAAVSAFVIGHGAEGAAVMVLYFLAEFLESKAKENAERSVASLMKLAPEIATVRREEVEVQVHVHDVFVSEIVIIRPGEKIPLDGVVVEGSSSVNQAPITGESLPISKTVDDEVFAGTINNEGYLEVQVSRLSNETVIAKILSMVEDAQKSKSSAEQFIDKFAKYYTPGVVVVAILVAMIPSLLLGFIWSDWIYRALVLLVISCPCAFAISTPVAMVSSLTSATQHGVLIKGSQHLEALGKVKVVAFDKTGTLTSGKLGVTDVIAFGEPEMDVLQVAASIEAYSEHPISQAIVAKAGNPGRQLSNVDDFVAIAGKGVSGTVEGVSYFVGSERLFKEKGIVYPEEQLGVLEAEGKTVILVGNHERAIGAIAVQDTVRSTSAKTIEVLERMRIKSIMVTGDNSRTAAVIAHQLGIEEFYAELMPEDKVTYSKSCRTNMGLLPWLVMESTMHLR